MRLAIGSGLVVLMSLLGATRLLGQESVSIPPLESVQALTQELAGAWERLDADAYLAFFAEDLVFYFDGVSVSRADFEAGVRATLEMLQASTFEITDPHIQILGEDAVATSFQLREALILDADRSEDFQAAVTLVWARRGGEWRVVLMHESLPPHRAEGGDDEVTLP